MAVMYNLICFKKLVIRSHRNPHILPVKNPVVSLGSCGPQLYALEQHYVTIFED